MKHCCYIAIYMASAIIKIILTTWKEKSPTREEACSWNVWLHQICHVEGNPRKYSHVISPSFISNFLSVLFAFPQVFDLDTP